MYYFWHIKFVVCSGTTQGTTWALKLNVHTETQFNQYAMLNHEVDDMIKNVFFICKFLALLAKLHKVLVAGSLQ